jgi:hypothetical protein
MPHEGSVQQGTAPAARIQTIIRARAAYDAVSIRVYSCLFCHGHSIGHAHDESI